MKIRKSVIAAGALLALQVSTAGAQQVAYGMPAPRGPEVSVERADELQAKAEALYAQPKQWGKAVRLLEKSAELRAADDAEAYTCYVMAGRLAAALGDNSEAEQVLRKAGEHALARGDVMDAASAFIDAAHAASRAGNPAGAQELLERAKLLSGSPLLGAEDRAALGYRLKV